MINKSNNKISEIQHTYKQQIAIKMKRNQQIKKLQTLHQFQQNRSIEIPKVLITAPIVAGPTSNAAINKKQTQNSSRSKQQQQIRKQNKQLRHQIQNFMEQIDKLKQKNQEHETQIETLLKFNERLLIIIETQLNHYGSRKSERSISLQPISEITEKDSDCVDVASIRASIMMGVSNIKLSGFHRINADQKQFDEDNKHKQDKKKHLNCPQTQRLQLGDNRDQVQSYSCSQAPSKVSYNNGSTHNNNVHYPYNKNLNTTHSNYQPPHRQYSDYQKQYSEYSPSQKLKQVIGLISNYKKQYGESAEQYEKMKKKIKQDLSNDNQRIRKLESEGKNFYDTRITQLQNIRQKISQQGVSSDLDRILQNKGNEGGFKYSQKTLQKLKSIVGSTQ